MAETEEQVIYVSSPYMWGKHEIKPMTKVIFWDSNHIHLEIGQDLFEGGNFGFLDAKTAKRRERDNKDILVILYLI